MNVIVRINEVAVAGEAAPTELDTELDSESGPEEEMEEEEEEEEVIDMEDEEEEDEPESPDVNSAQKWYHLHLIPLNDVVCPKRKEKKKK